MPSTDDGWRARLRMAIDHTNKKHSYIAKEAGIDPCTLSRILTGKMRNPSFASIVRVVHVTGESVGWVLGEQAYALSYEQRELLRRAAATILKVTGDS